jgi:hypothetical protein
MSALLKDSSSSNGELPPTTEFDHAINQRSMLVDPLKAGHTLMSAETTGEGESVLGWLVTENFGAFLKLIHPCSPLLRDCLISYYIIGRPQSTIGALLDRPQRSVATYLDLGLKHALHPDYSPPLVQGKPRVPYKPRITKQVSRVIYKTDPDCVSFESS